MNEYAVMVEDKDQTEAVATRMTESGMTVKSHTPRFGSIFVLAESSDAIKQIPGVQTVRLAHNDFRILPAESELPYAVPAPEVAPAPPRFAVYVHRVSAVREAPGTDTLTLVTLDGFEHELVANKREDGSFRYQPGDLAVAFPEGAILDEPLLRQMGYWDEAKNRGMLAAGSKKNRVKMQRFAGIESRGAMMPVPRNEEGGMLNNGIESKVVREGDDVTVFLRVIEHVAA